MLLSIKTCKSSSLAPWGLPPLPPAGGPCRQRSLKEAELSVSVEGDSPLMKYQYFTAVISCRLTKHDTISSKLVVECLYLCLLSPPFLLKEELGDKRQGKKKGKSCREFKKKEK